MSVFGGATRALELYEGWYLDRDTGEPVRDQWRGYTVAVSPAQVESLRKLLRQACVEFAQKCIYMSVAGYVEFVEASKDETN